MHQTRMKFHASVAHVEVGNRFVISLASIPSAEIDRFAR